MQCGSCISNEGEENTRCDEPVRDSLEAVMCCIFPGDNDLIYRDIACMLRQIKITVLMHGKK